MGWGNSLELKNRTVLALGLASIVLLGCAAVGIRVPAGSAKSVGVSREQIGSGQARGSRIVCNRLTGHAYSTGRGDFSKLAHYYKLTDRSTGKVSYVVRDGSSDVPCSSPAACKSLAQTIAQQAAKSETNRLIRECKRRASDRDKSTGH